MGSVGDDCQRSRGVSRRLASAWTRSVTVAFWPECQKKISDIFSVSKGRREGGSREKTSSLNQVCSVY